MMWEELMARNGGRIADGWVFSEHSAWQPKYNIAIVADVLHYCSIDILQLEQMQNNELQPTAPTFRPIIGNTHVCALNGKYSS
jgi:hypothetical protein